MVQIKLTIFRWEPSLDRAPTFASYTVPYSPGMTLLDALRFIQAHFDPTLAFRWECRKATCGICAVMLDGQVVLACHKGLDPQTDAVVTPLTNFLVIKDLIVDLRPALERLALTKPYLVPGDDMIESKAEADLSRSLRSCLECWACVAVCPVVRDHSQGIADPVGMVRLARFALDKRDRLDRIQMALDLGVDKYDCAECLLCMPVCPKEIDIVNAITALRGES